MKISEAIREGCKGTRKWRWSRQGPLRDGKPSYCAIGAMRLGIERLSKSTEQAVYDTEQALVALETINKHPIYGTTMSMFCVIIDLNDNHLWKRERIADWVASEGF